MLSLKGHREIDQSDKAKPKPLENNLCEDMKDECLRNFCVGSQRTQEAGKKRRLQKLTGGRCWTWMKYQGLWVLLGSDGQTLKEFCSPCVLVICVLV